MIFILIFFLGMFFITFLYPFLANLANLFASWVDAKTSMWSLYIQKAAIDMDLAETEPKQNEYNTQVVGFQVPDQCDCEDYEEYE